MEVVEVTARQHVLLLRRPGVVLGSVLLLVAIDALVWTLTGPAGNPVGLDALMAGLVAVMAVGCLLVPPGAPRWILEAAAGVAGAVVAVALSNRVTAQGIVSVGVLLLMLLVAAATFVPLLDLVVGVGASLSALGVGLVLNPVPVGGVYVWVLGTAMVAVPLLVYQLVTELRGLVAFNAEAAVHDPLTGALNRRGVAAEALKVHAVSDRAGTPTSLVAIDLDGFKEVNDTRGHAAGDDVLVSLVSAWSGALRVGDVLGRTGGDEFLVVLPNADAVAAEMLVARLRAAHPFPWSYGVAAWEPDEDLDAAMARADSLLYQAKTGLAPDLLDLRDPSPDRSSSD